MRITKSLKEIIVNKAIEKSGILEEFADLRVARAAWAEKCRIDAIGGVEKADHIESVAEKINKLLKTIPEKALSNNDTINRDYDIYMNVAGMTYNAHFSGYSGDDCVGKKGIKDVWKYTFNSHTIIGGSPLAIEFDELIAKQRDLNKRYKDMCLQVEAAVSKFTTTEKMIKVWPESVELIPATDLEVQKAQLPALLTDDLNKLIGLPTVGQTSTR